MKTVNVKPSTRIDQLITELDKEYPNNTRLAIAISAISRYLDEEHERHNKAIKCAHGVTLGLGCRDCARHKRRSNVEAKEA